MEKSLNKALEIEKEYLSIVDSKEQEKFNLKERLELCGFTLESFSEAKEDYLFKQAKLEIRETTPATIQAETMEVIQKGEQVAFIISQDCNWCFYGIDDANKKYVEDNNIKFLDLGYQGGTIISTPKDLEMVIIIKQHSINSYIRDSIGKLLNNIGVEHKTNSNDLLIHSDLLIEDYKICGFAERNLGNEYSIYYAQISFEINNELISNICVTESKKIPKGINYFYPEVNRDMLVKEIKQWLQ